MGYAGNRSREGLAVSMALGEANLVKGHWGRSEG